MDRREAIRRTAFIMGGVVSAPTIMGILQGCSTKPNLDWKPTFFNEDQAYVISQIAEIYIPQTDTPGAKQIGAPAFIETFVSTIYDEKTKERFMNGLASFMTEVESETGDAFHELTLEEQTEQVKRIHDKAAKEENKNSANHGPEEGEPYKRPFITLTKEITLLAFFTSEPGATQVLQYDPVPGAYHGCKPLSEVGGKTWAT